LLLLPFRDAEPSGIRGCVARWVCASLEKPESPLCCLLCPGWERPQNERRAIGSDSEVAPLGWRKTRKGASATRGRRRMRRGSAAWCGLPQSPHPEIVELVAASRRRPPYVFSRPARALTETETSLLDSCWFGSERVSRGGSVRRVWTGERKYPWSQTPVPGGPDFLGQGEGQGHE